MCMRQINLSHSIDQLFLEGNWEKAQQLLEQERDKAPEDHWVLTQLGVTLYEQKKFGDALPLFLASLRIVPDCPLTLWNLAGTLDALGNPAAAAKVYTWLLGNDRSAAED